MKTKLLDAAKEFYRRKEEMLSAELMARLERYAMLSVIDTKWKEHLREMDDMKEGIGFVHMVRKIRWLNTRQNLSSFLFHFLNK